MVQHTCRSGGVRRILKTECLSCMRAERSDLLAVCKVVLQIFDGNPDPGAYFEYVDEARPKLVSAIAKAEATK